MAKVIYTTVDEYIEALPDERKEPIVTLRKVINDSLPSGFEECINYNMIGRVVPHSRYPDGYHCNPKLPLPFMNLANQKKYVALYHMGIYSNPDLMERFVSGWNNLVGTKLDMGKSCLRFKKMEAIPYELIGELASKVSVNERLHVYESSRK